MPISIRLFFLSAFGLFLSPLSAQEYKAMMNDPRYSITEVKAAANAWFAEHGTEEGSGYKGFQRWLWANEYKYNAEGKRSDVDPYFVSKEWARIQSTMEKTSSAGWVDMGPYSIDSITGHYSPGLGRVECFYFDPSDPDFLYLGSRSGGFWKSTNGGQTWARSSTEFLPATGVNTMAVNPNHRDSVLINLRNARNGTSHGIYRSVDGGQTWAQTPFNPSNISWTGLGKNGQVYQLIYHPDIPHRVYVGTNNGLYISNDDLQSWTQVLSNTDITHIKFHPTDTATIYVYDDYYWGNNGDVILVSHDGGQTFSASATLSGNNGANGEIAVSPACPDCLYAASGNGVWKSTNEGQNFTFMTNPSGTCDGFAVSDQDTSIMIYGMLDIFRSTDGGQNFNQITWWSINNSRPFNSSIYVHADLREIESHNGEFYIGTDGFLAKSSSQGLSWQRLSSGTGIRENYSIGIAQNEAYTTIAGSQDNGTSIYRKEGWVEFYGADGMEGLVHPLNHDWMMGSVQYGTRRLTFDGGKTQTGATPNGQSGAWEAPLDRNGLDHFTLYHFGDQVYESNDFGQSWNTLGSPLFSGEINRAAMAPNSGQIMAVARSDDFEISTDGGQTFRRKSTGLPNSTITDITFAPHSDSIIVVTYGAYQNDGEKVFISYDQGNSWSNITGNLGDMPIRSVVIDNSPDHNIYLGAEIGVYVKALQANNWFLFNADLPNVSVTDLEIMHGANLLRAATWGRGMWQITLKDRLSYPRILNVDLDSRPSFLVPTDAMAQHVHAVVGYSTLPDTVYVQWSAGSIALDSVRGLMRVQDSTYKSLEPIPAYPLGTDMYFKVFAVGTQNDTSSTYRFHYRVQDTGFCKSGVNGAFPPSYIEEVIVSNLQNNSGRSGYSNFTQFQASLNTNQNYTLSVKVNSIIPEDSVYAWIDYNNDTVFTEDERIQMTAIDPQDYSYGTIALGQFSSTDTVRMRIRIQDGGLYPDPCNYFNGEAEDYSVILVGNGLSLEEWNGPVPYLYPNPSKGLLYLANLEGNDFESYRILNTAGQVLQSGNLKNYEEPISIQKLKAGSYYLELSNEEGRHWHASFIKE